MLTACQTSSTKENPLLTESTLDYQAPDFSKIRPAHFVPAIEEGIRIQLAEIDSITSNTAAPTFENTVLAYEKSGRLLARATSIWEHSTAFSQEFFVSKLRNWAIRSNLPSMMSQTAGRC